MILPIQIAMSLISEILVAADHQAAELKDCTEIRAEEVFKGTATVTGAHLLEEDDLGVATSTYFL